MELPQALIQRTLPTYNLVAKIRKNDSGNLVYLKKEIGGDRWIKSVDKREFEVINLKFKTSQLKLVEQTCTYTPSMDYYPVHLKNLRKGCKLFINQGFLTKWNEDGVSYTNRFFINPDQFKTKQLKQKQHVKTK